MCKEEIWNIAKEILTTRNFEIMLLRCGKKIGNLGSEESMTLEEIGAKFNLTKERVRQIESFAINKIRNSKYCEELIDYTQSPTTARNNLKKFKKTYYTRKRTTKNFI